MEMINTKMFVHESSERTIVIVKYYFIYFDVIRRGSIKNLVDNMMPVDE